MEEQDRLRLSGLRILARLVARRCLADLQPGVDEGSAAVAAVGAAREAERA